MKIAGCLTLFIAFLWSAICFALFRFVGAGEMAVVKLSRWLDIPVSSTQWIAELFALAGGVAQLLVVLVWLLGIGVVAVFAWLGISAAGADATRGYASQRGHPHSRGGAVIDGEVSDRRID